MSTKHIIYKEKSKEPTVIFEWKLEKYIDCMSNKPQGFLLSFRKVGTKTWTIFVDGTASNGCVESRVNALKDQNIITRII